MIIMVMVSIIINGPLILWSSAARCDFEQYATGCFAAANFICDAHTNECKCHHEVPVLIDSRWCVKRSRFNQICQYNQQCDNSNGLYCLYSDFKVTSPRRLAHTLTHFSERYPKCRCKSPDYVRAFTADQDTEVCVHKSKHSADSRLPPGTVITPDNLRHPQTLTAGLGADYPYAAADRDDQPATLITGGKGPTTTLSTARQSSATSSSIIWYTLLFIIFTALTLFVAIFCCTRKDYEQNLYNMEPPPYEVAIKY